MAKRRRIRWDRVLLVFGPILLLILLCTRCHHRGGEEDSDTDPATVESMNAGDPSEDSVVTAEQTLYRDLVLVIDAGHGGNDDGAVYEINSKEKRYEKDDDLRLALAVEERLNAYPHVQVIMTRETDVYVELQERCDIANNANADFFISLHRNSATSGKGVEIWINNDSYGDVTMDRLLAWYIMDWLEKAGISNNRGIKKGLRNSNADVESDNYYVNRFTNMPSCLVEMGFMTSEIDNSNFDTKLNEYADAIAGAVLEFVTDKGIYTENGVPTYQEPAAEQDPDASESE